MKTKLSILFLFVLVVARADVIPSNRITPWVPNNTVGVVPELMYGLVTGISNRPVSINVQTTNSSGAYYADSNGVTDASDAINQAINDCTYYQAVHVPFGTYKVTKGIQFNKDLITLRGDGPTNTIFVGHMVVSVQPKNGNYPAGYGIAVASGATKGSTNITFVASQDTNGVGFSPGDSFMIGALFNTDTNTSTNALWQYISSGAGATGESQSYALQQRIVLITNISGNSWGFTPPLVYDFTNAPAVFPESQIGNGSLKNRVGVGMENFCFQTTNSTIEDDSVVMVDAEMLFDSWITNCYFLNGVNYNIKMNDSTDCYFAHNNVRLARSTGSNHAGLYLQNNSGCLIEDIIGADGLAPGIEWNNGVSGNAFFGNFFTNNVGFQDIVMHNSHMVMNLWEENKMSIYKIDGYFGSCSHQTVFRDAIFGSTPLKRWTTFINVVGCVLGNSSLPFTYFSPQISSYDQVTGKYAIFEVGWPNIGSTTFDGVSGPVPYNFPGWYAVAFAGDSPNFITNGYFTITNTQVATNIITGNFTNLWGVYLPNLSQFYHLLGQDPVNTNTYWPIGTPVAIPTLTNINFGVGNNATVSNGWRVFISNQQCYQQLQSSNILTDILTGNAVVTNQSTFVTVWDGNGVQSLPTSYLYTNGAPSWWSGPWPLIDGTNPGAVTNLLPAEARYYGIVQGGGGGGGGNTPISANTGAAHIIHIYTP